jgi:hypothetical protein
MIEPVSKDKAALMFLRIAVFHLASCWDALARVESESDSIIEVSDICSFAGDVDNPNDAMHVDDDVVRQWLDFIKVRREA